MKYNYVKDILDIAKDEIQLSNRADEIDTKTNNKLQREITTALKKTLETNDLTALAAPEIGYDRRIFVINFDTEVKTFINPMLTGGEGLQLVEEKSNVIPGKRYIRARMSKINLIYQRPTGQPEHKQFIGKAALYIQQMLDALDGILESDVGLEIDEDFDNATDAEKDEILRMYLDSIDLRAKMLDEEIKEDKQLSQTKDAIKYMTSVISGETKLDYQKVTDE